MCLPTNSMVTEAPHSEVTIVVPFDSNLFPDGVHEPWYTKIGSRSSTTVIAIMVYVDQRCRLVMYDGTGEGERRSASRWWGSRRKERKRRSKGPWSC
jgi:hypothetical protein